MEDPASTRASLLLRLRDPQDKEAWQQFVDRYGPLVYQFVRQRGLQDADAADLTQIVFQALIGAVKKFEPDPQRGSFRGWLFTVVRNQLHKHRASAKRAPQATGHSEDRHRLDQQPAPDEEARVWDQEYERNLFVWAADRVRGRCDESSWRAFWLTAVNGKSAVDVAQELGMTVGAVYTAKSRALDRIRKEIQQFQDEEG